MMIRSLQTPVRPLLVGVRNERRRYAFLSQSLGGRSSFSHTSLPFRGILRQQQPTVFSVTTVRHMSSHNIEKLRLLTDRILDIKGPLSPTAWNGAETAFDLWTCHPVTLEGAQYGWKLLDRLVQDQLLQTNNEQRLTVGWLHRMVVAHYKEDLAVDPQLVLAKLEGYAPVLQVDDKTRAMLEEIEAPDDGQEQCFVLPTFEPIEPESIEPVAKAEDSEAVEGEPSEADTTGTSAPLESTKSFEIEQAAMASTIDWEEAQQRLMSSSNGEEAFSLLDRLVKEHPQNVSTEWLNQVIQSWCDGRIMEPTRLLMKLNDYAPLPDATTYDIIVSAIRNTTFLDQPVGTMTLSDWKEAEARLTSLTTSKSATPDDIQTAWKILDRLVEEEQYGKEQSAPGDYESRLHPDWLNRIVEAWCQSSKNSTDESADILVRINKYVPHLSPDPYIYHMIVDSVRKASGASNTRRNVPKVKAGNPPSQSTAKVPQKMRKKTSGHDRKPAADAAPTTFMYNAKIQKLKSKRPDHCDPDKAEALLEEMWDLYHAGNKSVKPSAITYSHVLNVLVNSHLRDGGERAEVLLRRMQELSDAGDDSVKPDSVIFTSVMSAWANSGRPDAADRAEAIFRLMQDMYQGGDTALKPDKFAYTALLAAISRSGGASTGDRAEDILKEMQESDVASDVASYNMVLKALKDSDGANRARRAERAEELLDLMEKEAREGNEVAKPNGSSYVLVILAWSRCQEVAHAGDRAEAVLTRMEDQVEAGNETVRLGRVPYNATILAHVRSGHESGAQKAESVLDRLEKVDNPGVRPNQGTYNMVIAAYSRQGGKSSALRAEELLNRMHDVKPNAQTHAKVAIAWVNSGDEDAAENALKYLEMLKAAGGTSWKQEFAFAYEKINRFLSDDEQSTDASKLEHQRQRLQRLRGDESEGDALLAESSSSSDDEPIDDANDGAVRDTDSAGNSSLSASMVSA